MYHQLSLLILCSLLLASLSSQAQKNEPAKDKKTVKEVINELPDMLIAQPETAADSNANKLINDNVSFTIPLLWKEKGLQTIIEFKLLKTDVEPLLATMPVPDKKLAQGLTINSGTIKKTAAEKKQLVIQQVKTHLQAYYKEAGISLSANELSEKVAAQVSQPESFKTDEGKTGELYYLNDIAAQQSNFIVLLLIPSADGTKTHFAQISYLRYNYETTLPEDAMELKTFVYPQEEEQYVDFTKKMLRTLRVL